jgi:predicted phosphoribosyltransferase
MGSLFLDRRDAGRRVAARVMDYANDPNVIVLALPRGGVPVAYEVAFALNAPLDVFVVRKLGVPGEEELAMGAIAGGGVEVLNEELIAYMEVDEEAVRAVIDKERAELERREKIYRGKQPSIEVKGKSVIVVDDGLATGSTMTAAIAALRQMGPEKIIVAVPTAAPSVCAQMREIADECICATMPVPFRAVGMWYEDFSQTSDDEVHDLLERARRQYAQQHTRSRRSAA